MERGVSPNNYSIKLKGCPSLQILQFFNIVQNPFDPPPPFLLNIKKTARLVERDIPYNDGDGKGDDDNKDERSLNSPLRFHAVLLIPTSGRSVQDQIQIQIQREIRFKYKYKKGDWVQIQIQGGDA